MLLRQYFRVFFFQRHGRRSSWALESTLWYSLVASTSASRPLANVPVTRLTRFRRNYVSGTRFGVPVYRSITNIYCMFVTRIYWTGIANWLSGNCQASFSYLKTKSIFKVRTVVQICHLIGPYPPDMLILPDTLQPFRSVSAHKFSSLIFQPLLLPG